VDLHALGDGGVDLPLVGGHLPAGPSIDQRHLVDVVPDRGSGCIDGRVATSDDHDALAHLHWLTQRELPEEIHTVDDVLALLTGDVEPATVVGASGDEDGVGSVDDLVDRHVAADTAIGLEHDTEMTNRVEIPLQHVWGESEIRDPHRQHATQDRQRFVHRGPVPEQCELVRRRQSRRPGADDRD